MPSDAEDPVAQGDTPGDQLMEGVADSTSRLGAKLPFRVRAALGLLASLLAALLVVVVGFVAVGISTENGGEPGGALGGIVFTALAVCLIAAWGQLKNLLRGTHRDGGSEPRGVFGGEPAVSEVGEYDHSDNLDEVLGNRDPDERRG